MIDRIQKFKNIFKGLERAHGCTKVATPTENGVKVKGQSFVVRQPVTDDLWLKHLQGSQSLGIIPINEEGQFCYTCHVETATNIDCFACHASVPRHNKLKAKQADIKNNISAVTDQLEYMVNR